MKAGKVMLSLLLSAALCCGSMLATTVSAAEQTYGIDNLNNEKGDLVIAYLGGSITEGSGASVYTHRYATKLTKQYFQEKFPNKRVTEVNGGVGGTPSNLGLFRVDKDIASKNPDVVFVEFAVNDAGRQEADIMQNMEGIVRQLARLPKQPVVIFLYTAKNDFAQVDKSIEAQQKVADHYGIATINLNSYVRNLVNAGTIIWNDKNVNGETNKDKWYSGDGVHPNDKGYQLYVDYIMELFNKNYNKYFKKLTWQDTPVSTYEYGFPKLVAHSDSNATYTGNWTVNNSRLNNRFNQGSHETTAAGATVTFRFTGRSIGLYATRGDEGASASYVIDEGTPNAKTGTINNYYKHGTNPDTNGNPRNPSQMGVSTMLRSDLAYGEHTIKITTNEPTQQNGYTQNLFSFGYFMVDEVQPDLPPAAKSVTVSGSVKAGSALSGAYKYVNYNDIATDEQGTTFRWLRADSENGSYTPIAGATAKTYTTTAADVGKYVKLEVTPRNAGGITGPSSYSEPMLIQRKAAKDIFTITEPVKYYKGAVAQAGLTVGDVTVKAKLQNKEANPMEVIVVSALYETVGNSKMMVKATKNRIIVEGNQTQELTNTIAVDKAEGRELRTFLLCGDNMEPIGDVPEALLPGSSNINFIGTEEDEEGTISIYQINSFNTEE